MISREQWILINQMSSAIECLSAPFCDSPIDKQASAEWVAAVAEGIGEKCSVFSIEDAIEVLRDARLTAKERNKS